jgi:hypothetical protein
MKPESIAYEAFFADFTGALVSFRTLDGEALFLSKPYVRVQKGKGYVLKRQGKRVTFLPVLPMEGE